MKRDMELIRKILFFIEENYVAGSGAIHISIDGYSDGEIYEHCKLAYQGGLIQEPIDIYSHDGFKYMVRSLTSEGFDFLDNIRDDTIWNNTKKVIKEKGLPMITETIKMIASAFVKSLAEGATNAILKQ